VNVSLEVFDAGGRRVATVFSGFQPQGQHQAAWDGRDDDGRAVGAGVYFYRLWAGNTVLSRKMVRLH
jgi:flagellar hook assembly protein FlgD